LKTRRGLLCAAELTRKDGVRRLIRRQQGAGAQIVEAVKLAARKLRIGWTAKAVSQSCRSASVHWCRISWIE
jgi:hypothetical protein